MKSKRLPIRILVVEDDPIDQELLLHHARKSKMADNVVFVPDALQALEFVQTSQGSSKIQLIAIFLDLHLPLMSGIELLRRIRTMPNMKDLPVIVMTSSTDPREEEECNKLNVSNYLHKSITSDFTKAFAATLQNFNSVEG